MRLVQITNSAHAVKISYVFTFGDAFFLFIIPISKSLVVPVIWLVLIDAIYSRIAPFFALNRIFFPANEEATIKTKQPIIFQGSFKVTNHIAGKWKTKCSKFCNICFQTSYFLPPRMDEFYFKPAQYCINKIFELTKSCIWAISISCTWAILKSRVWFQPKLHST